MPRHSVSSIQQAHEYGLYTPTRTIILGSYVNQSDDEESGINSLIAQRFIINMHILESASKTAPINIIINNPGGDVPHGIAVFDSIKTSKCHTIIKVYGMAMSMSAIILQAGSERLLSRNSSIMIHDSHSWASGDSVETQEVWVKEGKKFNDWQAQLFLSKMKKKDKELGLQAIREMLKKDTVFSAKEAIEAGLADGYISENTSIFKV